MSNSQRVLVHDGEVAYDDEWPCPPSETMGENYWEGARVADMTNGVITSGEWEPA